MTFSQEWEQRYQGAGAISLWPWSDLVRLFRRHFGSNFSKRIRVLELGCGSGANIPFFAAENVEYYAIEGSSAAVSELVLRNPSLAGKVKVGDFTLGIPFDIDFDAIIDRSSVTHNDTASIKKTLEYCYAKLQVNGIYIGIDWFSDDHSDLRYALPVEGDSFTFDSFAKGRLCDVGKVHVSSYTHLKSLFKRFELIWVEKKAIQQMIPDSELCQVTWNFVARKNGA